MKRLILASQYEHDQGLKALRRVYTALDSAYHVLSEYEDNIEQILNDPSFYESLIDEVRYLESQVETYDSEA